MTKTPLVLLVSIILGVATGFFFGHQAVFLKPLGTLFLNLIFSAVVPMVFFCVSSAIARAGGTGQLGKIFLNMILVFAFMGVVAAIYMISVMKMIPMSMPKINVVAASLPMMGNVNFLDQIVNIFTVGDFSKLFTHQSLLALIVFSLLVGLGTNAAGEKGRPFLLFLQAGEEVFMKVFSFIMYYAPIGFFAYFATLVSEMGLGVMENYAHIVLVYYIAAAFYFVVGFSLYAYLAGKKEGVQLFWKNIFIPATTAFATSSSAACIPANLEAAKKMRVPSEIYETIIPLGTVIHKQGSTLGGIVKIAFLFGIYHVSFSGFSVLTTAMTVAILVGTVMGAIPSGGMLGEMLIITVYGFPPAALILIAAIGILIDPMATMLNVSGNTVGTLLISRLVKGKENYLDS